MNGSKLATALLLAVMPAVAAMPSINIAARQAAKPVIGTIDSSGEFFINNRQLDNEADLRNGAVLKTGDAMGTINYDSGRIVEIGTDSIASIYKNRLILEDGNVRVDNITEYKIDANGLRVEGVETGTTAFVRVNGNQVSIAATDGEVKVYTSSGSLIARVDSGEYGVFQRNALVSSGNGFGDAGGGGLGGGEGTPPTSP